MPLVTLLVIAAGCSAARADDAVATSAAVAPVAAAPSTTTIEPASTIIINTTGTTGTTDAATPTTVRSTTTTTTTTTTTATPITEALSATTVSPPTTERPTANTVSPPRLAAPTTTSTAMPRPLSTVGEIDPGDLPHLTGAFDRLAAGNAAASITVLRDHVTVYGAAAGVGSGMQRVTTDTPLVLASVSKLVTALTVARLAEAGAIDLDAPVPWRRMKIAHDASWNDVTVRELLAHTSGMPKAQSSWLTLAGSCAIPLAAVMAAPPTPKRGEWVYSNGNYCALGLLVEAVGGASRGKVAQAFVFDPIHVTGPHLTTGGLRPTDGPFPSGVTRLERLGGAGTWMASSDDVAAMLDSVNSADLNTLSGPGVMADQYGWGHTGTVDGAKACAWVMEQGRTVVVAIVAGDRPSTGGQVCDLVIPALATDLGIWAGKPIRQPA